MSKQNYKKLEAARTCKRSPLGFAVGGLFGNGPSVVEVDLDVSVGLLRHVEDLPRVDAHLVHKVVLKFRFKIS